MAYVIPALILDKLETKICKKQRSARQKMIKNIIFDIDGVLVDCDRSYLNFLSRTYPQFKNMTYDDLPVVFPIHPDNGSVKLPLPFSDDFKNSSYYSYRPLFEDTLKVLHSLKNKGFHLFTLSAARNPVKKQEWLEKTFVNIFDRFDFSPAEEEKSSALKNLLAKYSLKKNETIFIDDRFHNIKAGLCAGVHTVRMQPVHSLPLPKELRHVKSFRSLSEFENYVDALNSCS